MKCYHLTPNETHPSFLKRKIIHFDMDCFYAAVEIRDNPKLKGRPVVIGGSPNSRGVVCTASYEARQYGIHSAMSCAKAKKLCHDTIFISPNFEKYKAASNQIHSIFKSYTDLIEPLSLDEAYLDVTNNHQQLYAVKIAKRIQEEIYQTTGLTGSAGIAPNKLIAKIASDFRKPNGMTLVLPEQVSTFIGPLPLRKISGIGPASEKKLNALGLHACHDAWAYDLKDLQKMLGTRMGEWLYLKSRGIDEKGVQNNRVRKSLSEETTFQSDLIHIPALEEQLTHLTQSVTEKLRLKNLSGKTITLKVKYANFDQITRSKTLSKSTNSEQVIFHIAKSLMLKTEAGKRKIRLLGLTLSKLAG